MAELNLNEKRVLIYSGERIKKLKEEQGAINSQLQTLTGQGRLNQQQEIDKIYLEERVQRLVQERESLEQQWITLSNKQNGKA